MSYANLPVQLQALVDEFAACDRYLAHPDGCENMCGTITYTFTERLRRVGQQHDWMWLECHRATNIERFHRLHHLSNWHVAPIWRGDMQFTGIALGTVVDFTARQFWPTVDFPLIEPLDTYRRRFVSVNLITPRTNCSGPSRMARKDRWHRGQFRIIPA